MTRHNSFCTETKEKLNASVSLTAVRIGFPMRLNMRRETALKVAL